MLEERGEGRGAVVGTTRRGSSGGSVSEGMNRGGSVCTSPSSEQMLLEQKELGTTGVSDVGEIGLRS